MLTKNNGALSLLGLLSRSERDAGSVADTIAANVSMMMLIHDSWTAADRMDIPELADATVVTKVMTTAMSLVEIWSCKNFQTALLTHRPT